MTAPRDRDAIVRAWIDTGPREMPDAVRYAITGSARTLPQRHSRRIRLGPVVGLGLAGLGVAAAIVLVSVLTPPSPRSAQIGTDNAALDTTAGSIAVTYPVFDRLELSVDDAYASGSEAGTPRAIIGFTAGGTGAYGFGPLGESFEPSDFTPGARGIVIADVTDMKLHGMAGQPLGNDPMTFLETMNASEWWDVRDVSSTTVAGRPAVEGRLVKVVDWWAHLDTVDAEGTFVEFMHPSHLIVTDVGETLVLVQVWAGTDAELDAWMPTATEFVEAIGFTVQP